MYKTFQLLKPDIFGKPNHNRLKMLGALAIDVVTMAVNMVAPFLIADNLIGEDKEGSQARSTWYAILLTSAAGLLLAQTFPRIRNLLLDSVRANTQKEIALALVKHVFALEMNHHLTARTGEFTQAYSKNIASIDKCIPMLFG